MDDFLEFESDKKAVKSINLDDFSIEDLRTYINELENEIRRAEVEVVKKNKWPIFELHAGHNAMYTHAKETLNLLMKICN